MNKILIKDYTPGAAESDPTILIENAIVEWSDEIDPPSERPIQYDADSEILLQSDRCDTVYGSFERSGLNLIDESTQLAKSTDNVGAVSGMITRMARCRAHPSDPITYEATDTGVSVTIEFGDPYVLSKGFKITMLESMQYNLILDVFYSDNTTKHISLNFEGTELQIDPLSSEWSTVFDWDKAADSVELLIVTDVPSQQLDSNAVFCKLAGFDFGCDKYVEDIDGTIDIHGEIALTVDDAPGCTCDVTVKAPFVPEEGQRLIVESDYYTGKFIIEKVEREAKDIFTLQCHDDIQYLDSFVLFRPTEETPLVAYSDPEQLLGDADVMWSDTPTGSVAGTFNEDINCREGIAMYGLATDAAITCWKDSTGIHQLKFKENNQVTVIDEDNVFAYATYESRASYKGVDFYYPILQIPDYHVVINTLVYANHANGYYVVDKVKLRQNGTVGQQEDVADTAQHIVDLLNGDEVTAEIIYNGEDLGDLVTIPTPYNGTVQGRIRSIDLQIGSNAAVATIIVRRAS